MTTPERLRRRQRREGWAVVALGIVVALEPFYFNHKDQENDEQVAAVVQCIAEQFQKLSVSLTARSDLTQRESNAVAKVLTTAATAKTGAQVRQALRDYEVERADIAAGRKDNPLPKFPTGRCDEDGPGNLLLREGFSGAPGIPAPGGGRVDGLAPEAFGGTPTPVHRAAGGDAGGGEREPHPSEGRTPGGHAGDPGDGGGPAGPGGGGGEPPGGPAAQDPLEQALDAVLDLTTRVVKRALAFLD